MLIKETDGKINFIDENDVFVGFDVREQCSEDFGYFISTKKQYKICRGDDVDVSGYTFNTSKRPIEKEVSDDAGCDVLGMVIFKLVKPGNKNLYLHLYNFHNGYYAHGWEDSLGRSGLL